MLKFSAVFVAFFVIVIEKFLQRKTLLKFHKKLDDFEAESKALNIDYKSYWHAIRNSFARKFFITYFWSFMVEIVMISSIGLNRQWQYIWLANLLPILACRILHLQYIYFVSIIKYHTPIIQDELQKLQGNKTIPADQVIKKLQSIKNLYGILHDLNLCINDLFTFSLTANFVHEYVQCGCDSFWTYLSYTNDQVTKNVFIKNTLINQFKSGKCVLSNCSLSNDVSTFYLWLFIGG